MSESTITRTAELAQVIQGQSSGLLTLLSDLMSDSTSHYADDQQEWFKNPELTKYRKDLVKLYISATKLRDRQELLARAERLETLD
jgi:lipopolysaccharide export system protein LptC